LSTLWSGPATKPSSDIEILKRSLDKCHLADSGFQYSAVRTDELLAGLCGCNLPLARSAMALLLQYRDRFYLDQKAGVGQ
jgi:hypothetical protein